MNKLEEYKIKEAFPDDWVNLNHEQKIWGDGYEKGFDAAIALDLPVKFAEWHLELECCTREEDMIPELWDENPTIKGYTSHSLKDTKVLYQYWIEKVYKPE